MKLAKKIEKKKFDKIKMLAFSKKNNIAIDKIKINGINDEKKFTPQLLKKIYNHNSGELFILSDSILQENFLVNIVKETDPKIESKSENYKKYVTKANAEYISKVYKSYDKYINANYKIEINEKVLERLKNSF